MNLTSKTIYYWIIIIIGLISTLISLNILRSRNKYPSSSSIRNILNLYINKFYNLTNPKEQLHYRRITSSTNSL